MSSSSLQESVGVSRRTIDIDEFLDSMAKGLNIQGSSNARQSGNQGLPESGERPKLSMRKSEFAIDEKLATKCYEHGVIDPKHSYKVYWDVLVGLLILYSVVVIPFRIGYDLDVAGFALLIDWTIDSLFFLDIMLCFNTGYYDDSNVLVTDKNIIRWRYIRTWFPIDVVSTVPIDTIMQEIMGQSSPAAQSFKLMRIMRLARLLKLARLARLARFVVLMEQIMDINPAMVQLVKVLGTISLLAHFYACGWYFIALPVCPDTDTLGNYICEEGLITENWARFFGAWRFSLRSKYVASLYFVITTMMGVGYGDIYALSYQEMWYAIVMMISGSCSFGFILASVGVLFDTLNPRDRLTYQTVSELKDWMSFRELRKDLRTKIRLHYIYYLEKKDLLAEQPIAQLLPEYLQSDLIQDIYSEKSASLKLFRTYPANDAVRFLAAMLRSMKPFFVAAEESLIMTGEVPVDLFILVHGRVEAGCPWAKPGRSVRGGPLAQDVAKTLESMMTNEQFKTRRSTFSRRRSTSPLATRRASHFESQVLHAVFLSGDHFSQYHVLGAKVSDMMYLTVTPCDMLSLNKEDLRGLMDEFPGFSELLAESALTFQKSCEELEKEPTVKHEKTGRPCKARILWRGDLVMLGDLTDEDVRGPIEEFPVDADDDSSSAGAHATALAMMNVMPGLTEGIKNKMSMMGREMLHNTGRKISLDSVMRAKRYDKERDRLVVEQEIVRDIVSRWILPPHLPAKLSWDIFMGFFILWTVLAVPFRLAFDIEVRGSFLYFEIMVDGLFFLDILLSFRTAYDDINDGALVTVPSMIAIRYLKSFFVVDFLSTVPLELILGVALQSGQGGIIGVKMIRILRLGRLFKLSRLLTITGIIDAVKKKIDMSSVVIRIIELILQLSFVAHYAACVFYFAGSQVQSLQFDACDMGNLWCVPGTTAKVWFELNANPFDEDTPTIRRYVTSVYWAFTTLCTVGYGDIAGTTIAERIVAIVVMLMGISMYSYIGGSISSLVSNGRSISSLFKKQSNMLRQSLDAIKKNVDPALINRIVQQCENVWRIRTETDEQYLSQLPTDIRNETILYLHRPYTPYISLISDSPKLPNWIAAPLLQLMTPETVNKGQRLEMWSGHVLYFVTSGVFQLEVVDEADIFERQPIYYIRGDTFGFEFAPTAPRSRPPEEVVCNKSMRVIALENCRVFGLGRHDVTSMLRKFPTTAEMLKSRIRDGIQKTADRQLANGDLSWHDIVAQWFPQPEVSFKQRSHTTRLSVTPPPIPPVLANPLANLPPLRVSGRRQSAASSVETREYFPFVIEDF